jgi:hypothetical protein
MRVRIVWSDGREETYSDLAEAKLDIIALAIDGGELPQIIEDPDTGKDYCLKWSVEIIDEDNKPAIPDVIGEFTKPKGISRIGDGTNIIVRKCPHCKEQHRHNTSENLPINRWASCGRGEYRIIIAKGS